MFRKAFQNTDRLTNDVDMITAAIGAVEFALDNPGVTKEQRFQRFKALLKEQQEQRKADVGADTRK